MRGGFKSSPLEPTIQNGAIDLGLTKKKRSWRVKEKINNNTADRSPQPSFFRRMRSQSEHCETLDFVRTPSSGCCEECFIEEASNYVATQTDLLDRCEAHASWPAKEDFAVMSHLETLSDYISELLKDE